MWENDLAREFKKRDNKSMIGACIGTVISVQPLQATIYDGQIMIDQSNGYICNHLLEHVRDYSMTGTNSISGEISINGTTIGSGSVDGSGSIGGTYATSGSFSATGTISVNGSVNGSGTVSGSIEGTGQITHKELLKAGDMVLVIPSGDEQKFFIVDILKGVS